MNYFVKEINYQKYIDEFNVSPLLAKVLAFFDFDHRQIDQLFNDYKPESLADNPNLAKVKNRLELAKKNNEKVFVFGDYDADGICSTTMMVSLLRQLDITCGYYIPNRLTEGYGLNQTMVENAKQKGYTLIITVDNGVSAQEALALANHYQIDVIICDHHIINEELSFPYLLHPSKFSESYRKLCGAGVVLQLALYMGLNDEVYWLLAMTATIGDMVELFDANRFIVKTGLAMINKKPYLPINALLNAKQEIDEELIAYKLIPALNTLGRLADQANVNVLVEYLLLKDETKINNTAKKIMALNDKRKTIVRQSDMGLADNVFECANYNLYISDDYHEGVIGLLANRMLQEYQKPILVGTNNNSEIKFSGRSVNGFDIHQQLMKYDYLFNSFGGHQQACGFSLDQTKLPVFIDLLKNEEKLIDDKQLTEVIKLELNDLSVKSVEELDCLRPFGTGIKQPLFIIGDIVVDKYELIKGKYPKATIFNHDQRIEVISFKALNKEICTGNKLNDSVGKLTINKFQNRKSINFLIEDIMYFNS